MSILVVWGMRGCQTKPGEEELDRVFYMVATETSDLWCSPPVLCTQSGKAGTRLAPFWSSPSLLECRHWGKKLGQKRGGLGETHGPTFWWRASEEHWSLSPEGGQEIKKKKLKFEEWVFCHSLGVCILYKIGICSQMTLQLSGTFDPLIAMHWCI